MGSHRSDRELGGAKRRIVTLALGTAAVTIALIAVAAWRWMPRSQPPATAQMRSAMLQVASTGPTGTPRPEPATHPRSDRERLMAAAFGMEGVPYKWGGKNADALDCSGFTKRAYAAVGVAIPNGSFNQSTGEKPLPDVRALTAGDLLFYRWSGSDQITHVTMYAGEGWVVGTGSPGQPPRVVVYPFASDLRADGRVITFRHIALPDER
jgi:cell wall-associated NlpC family hydrolase